ncbi:hypothetical protein Tco_0736601 [Tanacetum coccineum]
MKDYGDDKVTPIPTKIFSVNNWALKKNQPERPPFTDHMLVICIVNELVAFQAPTTSSQTKKNDYKGAKCGAKTRRRKKSTLSTINNPLSKLEATKNASLSKEATESQVGHFKRTQQATSSPGCLWITSEVRADPQLISVVSVSSTELVFSASTMIHFESSSGHDALANSTAEANPGKSAPKDLLSQQQGNDEGSKNFSFNHIIEASNEPEFDTSPEFTSSDDVIEEIKLEDLSKLVKDVGIETMKLDFPKDDQPFMVLNDEEEVLLLQSQNNKLEKEKAAAEAEAAFLSAQPLFPNMEQFTKLLVKSMKPELSKLLTYHGFCTSIPTELKELLSKIVDINGAVEDIKKYVEELEVEIPGELKELPGKLKELHVLQKQVSSINVQLSKLKVLDALPSLLNKVIKALDRFAHAIESSSQKASDTSVPSAGQADTRPAEGENPLKTTLQPEGEQVKDKSKKVVSHEEMVKETVKVDAETSKINKAKQDLIDLLGFDVVENMYIDKVPITLKVYRDDGSDEVIQNFKASDLHLGEWKEVIKACPKRTRAGSTKKYKRPVQFNDHQAGTVLNEPSLGMILFNSSQTNDFVSDLYIQRGGDCWVSSEPFSFSVDLNIKYPKYSLAEDSSASILQALGRSSSIFTSVYVAVQKLKKALARASLQLGWQCQAE